MKGNFSNIKTHEKFVCIDSLSAKYTKCSQHVKYGQHNEELIIIVRNIRNNSNIINTEQNLVWIHSLRANVRSSLSKNESCLSDIFHRCLVLSFIVFQFFLVF